MPTYEYACRDCGGFLEVVQKFSDRTLTVCPTCGGSLKKVFGSVGIVLKGSGFYRTDNRTSSRGRSSEGEKAERADKASGKPSEKTSEKTSEKASDKTGKKPAKASSEKST